MEYITALVLVVVGLIMILGSKKIALDTYRKLPGFFKSKIGNPVAPQDNWYVTYNRWGVVFIGTCALLASYTVIFGPIQFSDGGEKLDLNKSVINCNFGPQFKKITFADSHLVLQAKDFSNYSYKDYYTNPANEHTIKSIVSLCTGGPVENVGDLTVQQGFFDLSPKFGSSSFPGMPIEDIGRAATYENPIFDLTLVYFDN